MSKSILGKRSPSLGRLDVESLPFSNYSKDFISLSQAKSLLMEWKSMITIFITSEVSLEWSAKSQSYSMAPLDKTSSTINMMPLNNRLEWYRQRLTHWHSSRAMRRCIIWRKEVRLLKFKDMASTKMLESKDLIFLEVKSNVWPSLAPFFETPKSCC